MGFDWKRIVGSVAPTIATALGGPLAGMAVSTITGALGIEATSQKDAEKKISEIMASPNPEVLVKLRKADQDFEVKLKELDIDLERLHAEDRKSARAMRTEMKDRFPDFITVLVTTGFFCVLGVHIWIEIPDGNKTFLNIMLGSLGTVWVDQMRFYFGSSKGSKRKDDALADAASARM